MIAAINLTNWNKLIRIKPKESFLSEFELDNFITIHH